MFDTLNAEQVDTQREGETLWLIIRPYGEAQTFRVAYAEMWSVRDGMRVTRSFGNRRLTWRFVR